MQLQVLWQFEQSFVPTRPIDDHDDIVLRVAAGDFVEEQLHAVAVDMRQNQRIESAIYRADRTVRIGVVSAKS